MMAELPALAQGNALMAALRESPIPLVSLTRRNVQRCCREAEARETA